MLKLILIVPFIFFWALDAATLKKRLQIRIVGQERDNALIVSWNDTSPGGSVSIEITLESKWSRQQLVSLAAVFWSRTAEIFKNGVTFITTMCTEDDGCTVKTCLLKLKSCTIFKDPSVIFTCRSTLVSTVLQKSVPYFINKYILIKIKLPS